MVVCACSWSRTSERSRASSAKASRRKGTGLTALDLVTGSPPYDLVVLDVMLPRLDGFSVLRRLREGSVAVPVLLLTARDRVPDKVTGLDLGEDYLTKPFTHLASSGRVERGWLGVTIQRVTPDLAKSFGLSGTRGALVTDVTKDSPAARAGLQSGDVIVDYDGHPVARSEDLPRAVADTPVGREVLITVIRAGRRMALRANVTRLAEATSSETRTAGVEQGKGALGLSVRNVTPEVARELRLARPRGVVVRGVRDDGPAASAGIRPDDVIVTIRRPSRGQRGGDEARARAAPRGHAHAPPGPPTGWHPLRPDRVEARLRAPGGAGSAVASPAPPPLPRPARRNSLDDLGLRGLASSRAKMRGGRDRADHRVRRGAPPA